MISPTSCRNLLLLLLCLTSGIVDVIGYLGLGHVFTANMTGNIVLLGLAIGHAELFAVLRSVIALAGFIAGVAAAAVIIGRNQEKSLWPAQVTLIIGIEFVILIVYGFLSGPDAGEVKLNGLILMISAAMGMQTTAARRLSVAGISTTVLTNNLANVIEDLIAGFRVMPASTPRGKRLSADSLLRIAAIAIYCLGAVAGSIVEHWYPFAVIWIPVTALGFVLISVPIWIRGPVKATGHQ